MSLIRKHGAVLQAWACLDLVNFINVCYRLLPAVALTRKNKQTNNNNHPRLFKHTAAQQNITNNEGGF